MEKLEPRTLNQLLEVKNHILQTTKDKEHTKHLFNLLEKNQKCETENQDIKYIMAFEELVYIYIEDL